MGQNDTLRASVSVHQDLGRQIACEWQRCQANERCARVALRLLCPRISLVYRSGQCDTAQPRDRDTRVDTQVAIDGSGASVGHSRSTLNHKALRRPQGDGRSPSRWGDTQARRRRH